MKKLILLAAAAVMSLSAAAESNWFAGGSVKFWRNAGKNTTELSVLPEVGYNFSDKFAVGGQVGYSYLYDNGVSFNYGVLSPYARYTFFSSERVNLFVDGAVDMFFGSAGDETAVKFAIGAKPGISFKVTDRLSLVAHWGFVGFQGGNDASRADNEGGFKFDTNNLSLGAYISF